MKFLSTLMSGSGIKEDTILKFMDENVNGDALNGFTDSEDLKDFVSAVKAGDDLKAMAAYKKARDSSMDEARLATILTKQLLS